MPLPRSSDSPNELTTRERKLLKSLSTPWKIQAFLNALPYNNEPDGDTCRSPRRVMRDRTAHCFEAALFAAAALRVKGYVASLAALDVIAAAASHLRVNPLSRRGTAVPRHRPTLDAGGGRSLEGVPS